MTGILLVNLGTPDSPKVSDVRKYLREFLSDERVIDIAAWKRNLLVNLIIAPFRAPKVAEEYVKIWSERGLPLLYYGEEVRDKLQVALGEEEYKVVLGMRYQNPSIESALNILKEAKVDSIRVIPLFPQYASATTGSVAAKVMDLMQKWQVIPNIDIVQYYHNHPLFIEAFVEKGRPHLEEGNYDHVIFSFHGIPERHLKKLGADYNQCCFPECQHNCAKGLPENVYCYRSACYETARLISTQLGLPDDKYTVCFQSRLGKDPWLQPYTDDVVDKLAEEGKKRVLAYSPAFVADCLETTLEVGETYGEQFLEAGGEAWTLVESLNASDSWIKVLEVLAREGVLQPSTPVAES